MTNSAKKEGTTEFTLLPSVVNPSGKEGTNKPLPARSFLFCLRAVVFRPPDNERFVHQFNPKKVIYSLRRRLLLLVHYEEECEGWAVLPALSLACPLRGRPSRRACECFTEYRSVFATEPQASQFLLVNCPSTDEMDIRIVLCPHWPSDGFPASSMEAVANLMVNTQLNPNS
jgi:hypothetical protein